MRMSRPAQSLFTKVVLIGIDAIGVLREHMKLHGEESTAQSQEVFSSLKSDLAVLRRTMWLLTRDGIIDATRGKRGGYKVSQKQLQSFRLLDVMITLGQELPEPLGLDRPSERLREMVYDSLDVTLEDFLSGKNLLPVKKTGDTKKLEEAVSKRERERAAEVVAKAIGKDSVLVKQILGK